MQRVIIRKPYASGQQQLATLQQVSDIRHVGEMYPTNRPIEPGEDLRAGRWWWETGDKECGIHYEMKVNDRGETVAVSMRGKADG